MQPGEDSWSSGCFTSFHDTFLQTDPGSNKPYLEPFSDNVTAAARAVERARLLGNKNVAGSYARSSLRADAPLLRVLSVQGERRETRFSLNERHHSLALEHLAYGQRISAPALGIILFRDYGSDMPGANAYVDILRTELGLHGPERAGWFDNLFEADASFLEEEATEEVQIA